MTAMLMTATGYPRCGDCGAVVGHGSICDHAGSTTYRDETGTIRVAGYYGTDAARRHYAEHCAARTAARIDAARETGRAVVTDGPFAGCLMPHGVSERVETSGVGGYAGDRDDGVTMETRRIMMAGRKRAYRRAVLRAARDAETARRASLPVETPETPETPATAATGYVNEWHGVPLRTLTALAENDPADEWGCREILSAFETAYIVRQARSQYIEAMMRPVPTGGRPTRVPVKGQALLVNGMETRASDRWRGTPNVVTDCVSIIGGRRHRRADGVTVIVGGTRAVFKPAPRETDGTGRTARVSTPIDETAARLRETVAHLTAGTD